MSFRVFWKCRRRLAIPDRTIGYPFFYWAGDRPSVNSSLHISTTSLALACVVNHRRHCSVSCHYFTLEFLCFRRFICNTFEVSRNRLNFSEYLPINRWRIANRLDHLRFFSDRVSRLRLWALSSSSLGGSGLWRTLLQVRFHRGVQA